jgi:hypothetical protein
MIPHCLNNQLTDGGKVVRPTHRPRSTPQKHYFSASGAFFLSEAEKILGPNAAGRIRYIEKNHLPHRASNPRPILDSRLLDGSEVVSLTCRRTALYPQEDSWYSFLLEAESTPGP